MTYLDTPVDATVSQWPSATVSYGDMCDFYNAYHDSAETMKGDIESLRNTISSLQRQNSYANNLLDNARLAILEAIDNEDFDRKNFEVVAEALDISLTKEVNVTINVTFSGTVDVPLGFDIEGDLERYIDFEATASGWGNVEIECDLFTDGVDVNVCKR